MSFSRIIAPLFAALFLLSACSDSATDEQKAALEKDQATEAASETPATEDAAPAEDASDGESPEGESLAAGGPFLMSVKAVGMTFEGPSEVPAGWVTIRLENASEMIHFGIVDVPPQGVALGDFASAMDTFQLAMDAINADDTDGMNAAFGQFPEWIGDLGRMGGVGLLSPGRVGETTVFLKPGNYILECYIKSNGVFHTTSPSEDQVGMMLPFTVTDEASGATEPEATAVLTITNAGYAITEGQLAAGHNVIRVNFDEQQAFPSVVGNDVHIMKVDGEGSVETAARWMNWMDKQGFEDPAPVEFLGGIEDMPAGNHGYISVDLEPGTYAFIGEVPDPVASGLTLPFTVE